MGLATFAVTDHPWKWVVLHEGEPKATLETKESPFRAAAAEGDFATKESAFEAAVAAASLAVREGHEVHVSVPGREPGRGTLGVPVEG